MKKRLSLTARMMLTTSALLVVVSILFAVFSLFNAYFNLLLPLEQLEVTPASQTVVMDASNFVAANMIFLGLSIVLGCGLTYWAAKFSLKPLKRWSEEMAAIDQDQLSRRIEPPNTKDELDTLVRSFNQLLDRLQKAFDREKRFSSAVAHELKTPLTVVKTTIEFLQLEESPEAADYAEAIAVVQKQNDRMIQLVRDLSLLSAPNLRQKSDAIPMDRMIREIEGELRPAMESKNIRFSYDEAEVQLAGSAVLLKHALSNLMENAIKYNVTGGEIHVCQTVANGRYELSVRDTGAGIPEEDAPYIFEPFYRADKSRNRQTGGSGLGLAIAREIVEAHGGTLRYEPQTPRGSVFTISLPL